MVKVKGPKQKCFQTLTKRCVGDKTVKFELFDKCPCYRCVPLPFRCQFSALLADPCMFTSSFPEEARSMSIFQCPCCVLLSFAVINHSFCFCVFVLLLFTHAIRHPFHCKGPHAHSSLFLSPFFSCSSLPYIVSLPSLSFALYQALLLVFAFLCCVSTTNSTCMSSCTHAFSCAWIIGLATEPVQY